MSDEGSGDSDFDSISDISSLGSFADRYAAKVTEEVASKKKPRKSKRKTTVEGEAGVDGETRKKRKSTVRKKKKVDGEGGGTEPVSAEAAERRKTTRKTRKDKLKGLNDRVLGLDDDFGDLEISADSPAKPASSPIPAASPAVATPVIYQPVIVQQAEVQPIAGALPMSAPPASLSPVPATRVPSPKVNVLSTSRVSPLPVEEVATPTQQYCTPREAQAAAPSPAAAPLTYSIAESAESSRKSSINYDMSISAESPRASFNSSNKSPGAVPSAIAERRRVAAAARAAKSANQSNKERGEEVVEFSAYETTPEMGKKSRKGANPTARSRSDPSAMAGSSKEPSPPKSSSRSKARKNSDSSDVPSLDSYMSSDDSETRAKRRKKEKQRQKDREKEEKEAAKKAKELAAEKEKARELAREQELEREKTRAEEAKREEKEARKRDKKAQKEKEKESAETDDGLTGTADDSTPPADNSIRLAPATPVPLTSSLSFGRKGPKDQGFCRLIRSTTYLNAIKIAHSETPKVLCASADSTVQIYNITDGAPLPSLVGHTDRVISLAVSNPFMYADKASGGKATLKTLVASGSRDEQLRIWDMDTAKCLHSIHAHKSPIWAVAIAVRPNGDVIVVSTSGDGSMRSWNGKTGKKMSNFKGHTDKILSVYIMNPLSDNPLVLSGGADKKIRVWELLTGAHIRMLEGHDDEINSVVAGSFSGISSLVPISGINEDKNHASVAGLDASKSTVIVSASKDLTVRVWDFKSGHLLFELLGHTACVYEVALMRAKESPLAKGKNIIPPGTPIIVSCSEDATVKLWNLVTGKLIKSLKWHSVSVRGIDVASVLAQSNSDPSSGISLIASCGWDKTIQFHELGEALYAQKEGMCSIS